MAVTMNKILLVVLISVFYCGFSNGNINTGHKHKITSDKLGRLREIPRKFDLSGDNVVEQFQNYISDIEHLANSKNLTVVYKVKIELHKPTKRRKSLEKIMYKKKKSKKFNVPLKIDKDAKVNLFKNAFTIGDEDVTKKVINEVDSGVHSETTEYFPFFTRRDPVGKYKPILNKVKIKFGLPVKPVKNKVITLTK